MGSILRCAVAETCAFSHIRSRYRKYRRYLVGANPIGANFLDLCLFFVRATPRTACEVWSSWASLPLPGKILSLVAAVTMCSAPRASAAFVWEAVVVFSHTYTPTVVRALCLLIDGWMGGWMD